MLLGYSIFMLFAYENSVRRFLDVIQTGDGINGNGNTVASRETLLREWLESRELLPLETYEGNHIMVKFPLPTGETCQLLLSQPVTKGAAGIWCVERWMDGSGMIYYDTPETDGTALDYYRQLQEPCDRRGLSRDAGEPLYWLCFRRIILQKLRIPNNRSFRF